MMNTTKTLKNLKTLSATLALFGMINMAHALDPHWDLPSCYIHVNDGCFNNQTHPCTDEEYNEFLDACHETYPNAGGVRPQRVNGLKALGSGIRPLQSRFKRN